MLFTFLLQVPTSSGTKCIQQGVSMDLLLQKKNLKVDANQS